MNSVTDITLVIAAANDALKRDVRYCAASACRRSRRVHSRCATR